jgi:hypothetical protein
VCREAAAWFVGSSNEKPFLESIKKRGCIKDMMQAGSIRCGSLLRGLREPDGL